MLDVHTSSKRALASIPTRAGFGKDFVWGISTSAYQVEGAHDKDGKGPSIWDDFTSRKGKVSGGQNANIACDFYHRFDADLNILKELGIQNFRFSLSWPRLIPNGTGEINRKGVAYYDKLIDTCLQLGITPWCTLYHWDLPLALEKQGGWTNRKIMGWFEDYATLCAKLYGDRIKHWMVLNEPMVFTGAGYFFGVHAPGRKSMHEFLAAAHHATLCQAIGAKAIRNVISNAEIGTTISCAYVTPHSASEKDQRAASKVDALLNRLFIEPALGLGYPTDELNGLRIIEKFVLPGDEERMVFDFNFLGIQCYTREVVRHSFFTPIIRARIVPPAKRNNPQTDMQWEVYPESIYQMIMKYNAYPGIKKIIVTENGAAFPDFPVGNLVHDPKRMQYIEDHIQQVAHAKMQGARVDGYFVWTLLDNFEWAEGYRPRFGLVYVDFKTQKRMIKSSALWYSEFVNS